MYTAIICVTRKAQTMDRPSGKSSIFVLQSQCMGEVYLSINSSREEPQR